MNNFSLSSVYMTLLFLATGPAATAQTIALLQKGRPASIRGLCVVDDNVAWASGSGGSVAMTHDGGKSWSWQEVKGYEKTDFRGIEAFSDKEAVIMSSGTPALVLKTTDGGASWKENYRSADTAYFFDAIAFDSPGHGLILGDPLQNKFLLLETTDGGASWNPFSNAPYAVPGEACFAASGTCLRVGGDLTAIATGGSVARLLTFSAKTNMWDYINLPVTHSKPSQGAFSFAAGKDKGIIVGGDYANDKRSDSLTAIYNPTSSVITVAEKQPSGFQSCVEHIASNTYFSTGTPGSNLTTDGGKTWVKIDAASYNVCRKAKRGSLVLLAGDGGKIGILKL